MNKNIFRALLLGAGAVIAMQQAEAMRQLNGEAINYDVFLNNTKVQSNPNAPYSNRLGEKLPPATPEELKEKDVLAKQTEELKKELKNKDKLLEDFKKKTERDGVERAKYNELIQVLAKARDAADMDRMLHKLGAYASLTDGNVSPASLLEGSDWDVLVSHLDSLTKKLNSFVNEQLDFVENRIQTRRNIDLASCKALLNGVVEIIDPFQEFEKTGGVENYVGQVFTNNLHPQQGEVDENKKGKIDSFATALESALYCVRLFAGMNREMLADDDNLGIMTALELVILSVRRLIPAIDLGNIPAVEGGAVISENELVMVVNQYLARTQGGN